MTVKLRTTVVTGAGSGIGRAVSQLLTERGGRVIGVDLRGAELTADLADEAGRIMAADRLLAEVPRARAPRAIWLSSGTTGKVT